MNTQEDKYLILDVKRSCEGPLPSVGREKLVAFNGKHYWLTHEAKGFRVRETNWKLENGLAVLRG